MRKQKEVGPLVKTMPVAIGNLILAIRAADDNRTTNWLVNSTTDNAGIVTWISVKSPVGLVVHSIENAIDQQFYNTLFNEQPSFKT